MNLAFVQVDDEGRWHAMFRSGFEQYQVVCQHLYPGHVAVQRDGSAVVEMTDGGERRFYVGRVAALYQRSKVRGNVCGACARSLASAAKTVEGLREDL